VITLPLLGNTLLRAAITRNLVSFPAQIPPFMRRSSGDMQERIVLLYFVRGWPVRRICERYSLSKAMAHKLLSEWRIRAIESGHIQEIQPGLLDALVAELNSSHRSAAALAEAFDAVPGIAAAETWPNEAIFLTMAGASSQERSAALIPAGSAA
jgi:transposase-like protein